MGAPGPGMGMDPQMKAMYLKAAAAALAGALANMQNPAGAAAITQTILPTPPSLEQSY